MLDPLINHDASILLLCRGEQDFSHIIPVKMPDSADSKVQWNEAQRVWNQHSVMWKSWIPCYGVKNVSIVEVRLCTLI